MTFKIPGSDFIKSAIFEDEPKPQPASYSEAAKADDLPSTPQVAPNPPTPTADNSVYSKLLVTTTFSSTKAGQVMSKYMPALLETVGGSKAFEAAFKIASRNDGITNDDIAHAFNEMRDRLSSFSQTGFDQLQSFKASSIDGADAELDKCRQDIAQLQTRIDSLNGRVVTARAKYDDMKAKLESAIARRKTEIEREEQERTNLLNKQ